LSDFGHTCTRVTQCTTNVRGQVPMSKSQRENVIDRQIMFYF